MGKPSNLQPGTILLAIAGLATIILYFSFLAQDFATLQGPGDSAVANAYATLAVLAALWGMLLVLLVVDQVRAGRSWWTRAAILLVPLAGIATLFATDYPANKLCQLCVVALPPIVGAYLLLGALPRLRARAWAGRAQAAMLLLMAGLSIYPIEKFIS